MIDLIVSWLCTGIAFAFQQFVDFFSDIFDYDITAFNNTFRFAAASYDVITDVALALVVLLAAWQLVMFFFAGADKAPANPLRIVLGIILSIGFVYYGNYLLELILDFCQYPYDSLQEIDVLNGGLMADDANNASIGEDISTLITSSLPTGSSLLYLILLILLCFNFVKLLLEIIERYCWTFVLLYLSPLAASTLASPATSGIYKKFFTMFISQCILLFLNEWCLKMACSGLAITQNGDTTPIVSLLLCYAFLRLAAKMDSYINQLGLSAATTGAGMGAEIMGAGMMIAASGAKLTGGGGIGSIFSGGASGGAGNPILGAAKLAGTYARRIDPISAASKLAGDAIAGGARGASEAFRSLKWDRHKTAAENIRDNFPPPPAETVAEAGSASSAAGAVHATPAPDPASTVTDTGTPDPAAGHVTPPVIATDGDAEPGHVDTTPAAGHAVPAAAPPPAAGSDSGSDGGTGKKKSKKEDKPLTPAAQFRQTILQGTKKGAAQAVRNSDNLISRSANMTPPASAALASDDGSDSKPRYEDRLNNTLTDNGTPEQQADLQESLESWSSSPHWAQSAMTHVRNTEAVVTDANKVAAVAKGLGAGKHSKDAATFIQVGFDGSPETPAETIDYKMDRTGIHAKYDSRDGYRHTMDIFDQTQYSRLSLQQREGLDKITTPDGHRYYIGITKTKLEPVKVDKSETKAGAADAAGGTGGAADGAADGTPDGTSTT